MAIKIALERREKGESIGKTTTWLQMCCFLDTWSPARVHYTSCRHMLRLKDSGFENLKVAIAVFIDLIFRT